MVCIFSNHVQFLSYTFKIFVKQFWKYMYWKYMVELTSYVINRAIENNHPFFYLATTFFLFWTWAIFNLALVG